MDGRYGVPGFNHRRWKRRTNDRRLVLSAAKPNIVLATSGFRRIKLGASPTYALRATKPRNNPNDEVTHFGAAIFGFDALLSRVATWSYT